jgi:mono/diheme cytochrome c family protein
MRIALVSVLLLFSLSQANTASAQGDPKAGKALWESLALSRCSFCHGTNGEGGFGPDLAGRQITFDQFKHAVRKPWGIMPAFVETQHTDQDLANLYAYLGGLPKVVQPGPWKVPVPVNAPYGQKLLVETYGCSQCHGATIAIPRMDAGAVGADFDWFKRLVYEHTSSIGEHQKNMGNEPGPIRMGNYSRARLPEPVLEEIWRYFRDDLKFRAAVVSRLTRGNDGSYNVVVENEGFPGKGLTAEDITVTLVLAPGTKVKNTTGDGYQGVRNDAQAKADIAVWKLPRLAPRQEQTYTIALQSGAVASGVVRWTKPPEGKGPDEAVVAMPRPAQAR